VEFGNFEDDTPLFDATLEAPKTAPAFPSAAVPGDDAGPWDRGFNERDPRLGYRAAIKSYHRGIEVAPQYFYLPYNLGALYQGLNRLRETEAQYRKAANVDAANGEPYNALGTIRAIQGKVPATGRFFEESLRLDPTSELARRNLAALK
jgi:tetratricopeptide (TPR) repeat protein